MKRCFSFLTVTALSVLTSHPAVALDCANTSVTSEMIECADKDYRAADQSLNKAYSAFKKSQDEKGNELLLNAQRAWLKFRDANCALSADQARGGTLAPVLEIGCLASMTKDRTKELNDLSKGLGE